jgi:hypothetical protein
MNDPTLPQLVACQTIMRRLFRRPISNMFWDVSPVQASPGCSPLSFRLISHRLSQVGYADTSSWVSDVRRLLMSIVVSNIGSVASQCGGLAVAV